MTAHIALLGASGRMGQEIMRLIPKTSGTSLAAVVDSKPMANYHEIWSRLPQLHGYKPNVVIDFSSPSGTAEIAAWCAKYKTPLVSGTTGLNEKQKKLLLAASKKTAIFTSPNMGIGINALSAVFKDFLKRFPATEIEIEETHHRFKKDKPSGTAQFLKREVEEALSGQSKIKIQTPLSLRGGEIFGIHKVYFYGEGEWLCFEHHATDRSIFARGALKAAQFIMKQKPGMYSMKDLLK